MMYYTGTSNRTGPNLLSLNSSTTHYYDINGETVSFPFTFRDICEGKDARISLFIQLIKILVNKNIYFRLATPNRKYKYTKDAEYYFDNSDPLFNIEFIGDNPKVLITCNFINDDLLIFSFEGDHENDPESVIVADNSILKNFEDKYVSKVREIPPAIGGGMDEVLELVILFKQLYSGNFYFTNIIKENNGYTTVLYAVRETTYYIEHLKILLNQNYSYDISLKAEYKNGPQVAHSSFILHDIDDKLVEKCFKNLEKSIEENIRRSAY